MASSDLASSESNCFMSVQCICILLRRAAHHWHCMAELAGNRSLFLFCKTSCEQRAVNSESNGSDTRRLRHGVLFGALEWVWTDVDNVDQSS